MRHLTGFHGAGLPHRQVGAAAAGLVHHLRSLFEVHRVVQLQAGLPRLAEGQGGSVRFALWRAALKAGRSAEAITPAIPTRVAPQAVLKVLCMGLEPSDELPDEVHTRLELTHARLD